METSSDNIIVNQRLTEEQRRIRRRRYLFYWTPSLWVTATDAKSQQKWSNAPAPHCISSQYNIRYCATCML